MENYDDRKKMDISVSVDSKSLEDKIIENENLKSEIENLKNDLTLIAEKELKRQSELLGCANTVEAVKEAQQKRSQHSTAYLTEMQVTGSNDSEGFDSTEDAILALNRASKAGNPKATEIINKMGKKVLDKEKINYQYEGKIADLARKPIKGHTESESDWNSRLAEYKKKQSWKNLNSVKDDGD